MLLYTKSKLINISNGGRLNGKILLIEGSKDIIEFPSNESAEAGLLDIVNAMQEGKSIITLEDPLNQITTDMSKLDNLGYIYVCIDGETSEIKTAIKKKLEYSSYDSKAFKSKEEAELYVKSAKKAK